MPTTYPLDRAASALQDLVRLQRLLEQRPGHAGNIQKAYRGVSVFLNAITESGATRADDRLDRVVHNTISYVERVAEEGSTIYRPAFGTALANTIKHSLPKILDKAKQASPSTQKETRVGMFRIRNVGDYGPSTIEAAAQALRTAATRIARRGERRLLYGPVLLVMKHQFAAVMTDKDSTAALYQRSKDRLWIDALAADRREAAERITHELGHRLWFRFLSEEQREAWTRDWNRRKHGGLSFVTRYASTLPQEDFAEVFAFWCGNKLPREHESRLKRVLGTQPVQESTIHHK